MGAVLAVNDMLFQSHAGALRFFPVWDAQSMGAASFRTLRGYGAFLASAAVDANGVVGPVSIVSEKGGQCVVESPWHPSLVVSSGGRTIATTTKKSPSGIQLFVFETEAGATYVLKEK